MVNEKEKVLARYLPANSVSKILEYQQNVRFHLRITKPRKTKLGDFRPYRNSDSKITVNGNLNPYEFLIVLLHEIAHAIAWEKYGSRIRPHGKEWRKIYGELLLNSIHSNFFPLSVIPVLKKCIEKDQVSMVRNEELANVLSSYNKEKIEKTFLKDIPDNTEFELITGRKFFKLTKVRTRYKCKEINTGKLYTIHALAEVVNYKVI